MLTEQSTAATTNPLAAKQSHFPAHAKRVIFLWMQGRTVADRPFRLQASPCQGKRQGDALPDAREPDHRRDGLFKTDGSDIRFRAPRASLACRSPTCCPTWVTTPTTSVCCLAWKPTAKTHASRRAPSFIPEPLSLCGRRSGPGFPTDFGTENENLPAFLTIKPNITGDGGSVQLYGSAFLPAVHQGTAIGGLAGGDSKNAQHQLFEGSLDQPEKCSADSWTFYRR